MRSGRISGERLHERVLAAGTGDDECLAALLREVAPTLTELVAMELLEFADMAPGGELVRLRDELVESLAERLVVPALLAEWRDCAADRAWRFIEDWAGGLASQLRDQAWIRRAVVERDPAAREALFRRLLRLFERAARRRGLVAQDLEDARQSFSLWLLNDDARALQRWNPERGCRFDAWFFVRATNQIDTWRRGNHGATTEDDPAEMPDDRFAARIAARRHLMQINQWLVTQCSERQIEIFHRHFILDESAADIAASLDMRREAVYMTISRLRKSIHELFDL